jgi:hypothetical protein
LRVSRELRYTFSELLLVMKKLVLIMKDKTNCSILVVVVAVSILGAAVFCGCDGVLEPVTMGNDDTDGGTDTDSDGDTDSDTDADSDTDIDPELCTTVAFDEGMTITVDGVCQEKEESCSGGYAVLHSPEGSCSGEKWCCVDDDQCVVQGEQYEDIHSWCESNTGDTTCYGAWVGISYVGCPNGEFCCIGYAGER